MVFFGANELSSDCGPNISEGGISNIFLHNNTQQANMPAVLQNTVDRLDKPSAYYQAKVSLRFHGLRLCDYAASDSDSRRSEDTIERMRGGRRHPRSLLKILSKMLLHFM